MQTLDLNPTSRRRECDLGVALGNRTLTRLLVWVGPQSNSKLVAPVAGRGRPPVPYRPNFEKVGILT